MYFLHCDLLTANLCPCPCPFCLLDLGDEGGLLEGEEFEAALPGGEDAGEEEDGEGDDALGEGEAVAFGEDGEEVGLGEEDEGFPENGEFA